MTAVRRRCACRVTIEAEPDPASIEQAVSVHNREAEHRGWRLAGQLERELAPTYREVRGELVTVAVRRVG